MANNNPSMAGGNDESGPISPISPISPTKPHLDIELAGTVYKLSRLDDQAYFELKKFTVPIEEDYTHLLYLSEHTELIYASMAKMYIALKTLFGPSGNCYDDWKGSFSFPFLLWFEHDGKAEGYLMNIFNIRSIIEFKLDKIVGDNADSINRQVIQKPFPDFPRSAIRYVISHIAGYLSGYFKAIEKRYDEPFFQTVQSNLMVFGFKDGHFFDAQYETEEAFQQAIQELKHIAFAN